MSTIHKCDKCGKAIKGKALNFSIYDIDNKFFDNWHSSFDFCDKCVKPLAVFVKGFLKFNKKVKK